MNYVAHVCRSSRLPEHTVVYDTNGKKKYIPNPEYCDKIWIDKDLTNARSVPPTWKYCEECCKRLGIDYDKQTPTSNLSAKELALKEQRSIKAKERFTKKKG